jgi:hypothetical protein
MKKEETGSLLRSNDPGFDIRGHYFEEGFNGV